MSALPTPLHRHSLNTAMRPAEASGSNLAVPIGFPEGFIASRCMQTTSNSSHSSSAGTPCSLIKTASRTARSAGPSVCQLAARTMQRLILARPVLVIRQCGGSFCSCTVCLCLSVCWEIGFPATRKGDAIQSFLPDPVRSISCLSIPHTLLLYA